MTFVWQLHEEYRKLTLARQKKKLNLKRERESVKKILKEWWTIYQTLDESYNEWADFCLSIFLPDLPSHWNMIVNLQPWQFVTNADTILFSHMFVYSEDVIMMSHGVGLENLMNKSVQQLSIY